MLPIAEKASELYSNGLCAEHWTHSTFNGVALMANSLFLSQAVTTRNKSQSLKKYAALSNVVLGLLADLVTICKTMKVLS